MNWHERIDRAERDGRFRMSDEHAAKSWVTCACGEQDPRIPRDGKGAPLDSELWSHGIFFVSAVEENEFQNARYRLALIEARATELLDEIAA